MNCNNFSTNEVRILRHDGSGMYFGEQSCGCAAEPEDTLQSSCESAEAGLCEASCTSSSCSIPPSGCGCSNQTTSGCGCESCSQAQGDCFCNIPDCPAPQNFCCEGITPTPARRRGKDIFAYITQIIDSKSVLGTQLNEAISVAPENCDLITEFTDCTGCSCTPPTLTEDACFRILAYESKIDVASPTAALTATDFSINQNTPSAIIVNNNNAYEVPLANFNSDIYNDICNLENCNSSAPLIVAPAGTTINFQASFVICGTVTQSSNVYKFKFIIRMSDPVTSAQTASFMLPEICLPQVNCFADPRLLIGFCYDSRLIAPALTVTAAGQLTLTGTLMILPTMNAESVVDKKVVLSVQEDC